MDERIRDSARGDAGRRRRRARDDAGMGREIGTDAKTIGTAKGIEGMRRRRARRVPRRDFHDLRLRERASVRVFHQIRSRWRRARSRRVVLTFPQLLESIVHVRSSAIAARTGRAAVASTASRALARLSAPTGVGTVAKHVAIRVRGRASGENDRRRRRRVERATGRGARGGERA